MPARPEFATNRHGERVADAINSLLSFLRRSRSTPPELGIASAYFNPGGYLLLADELDRLERVRFLLGADPPMQDGRLRRLSGRLPPARAAHAHRRELLRQHEAALGAERDLLGFTIEADAGARRLVDWLRSGRVEVRRLEDAFLHGKAFIITTDHEGVIAGSSNFTYAGLATNLELNLGQYQPGTVRQVVDWFDELWGRAKPFDLVSCYEVRFEEHSPYLIYLRMLYERYGAELQEEAGGDRTRIRLTSFQRDGLWRAKRILRDRRGVLIADEVGLGKTFLAGELIREAVEERRQRVVVAPATLRDGPWRKFLSRHQLGVQCLSFEELVDGRLDFDPGEYAMVVVDEAHNVRNLTTQRAQALQNLLAGAPAKDLVLLTATPVNNSLWDLYSLLYYFVKNDAAFADSGITSLRDHFAEAIALNPEDLTPEHLFDVLDAVAVRRTRPFVRRYYPNDTVELDGATTTITFPTPRVRKVSYDLDDVLPGFFPRFAHALEGPQSAVDVDPEVLTLARYAPSQYRLDREVVPYEVRLAGLLRSGLLKRFESSARAFALTCRTMARSHDAFLDLLDSGWVATGDALTEWMSTDSDEVMALAEYVDKHADALDVITEYDDEALRSNVARDRDLLLTFAAEAESVGAESDPKLAALVDELVDIAAEAATEGIGEEDVRDRRKVLVFSYFADSVDWIFGHLKRVTDTDPRLAPYRGRVSAVSGRAGSKEDALWGFAPRTTDAPPAKARDRYDILVATDVLSEGVNLQQARHIVNYDLPWNPMRLVQRHGRIDRIGSRHREVFLRCIFPDRQLDELLGLEQRLQRKLKQAAASVGLASMVLPDAPVSDVTFTETREEIERLRAGDATLFERGGTGRSALSGEEYRQQLREALEDPALADRIVALPWGSGSGMAGAGAQPGYVFCARVADHPRVQFRYVELDEAAGPRVVEDTLACLANAHPEEDRHAVRVLDDVTHRGAFNAWELARDSIVHSWNSAADPANLSAKVPATMHRAVDLVRTARPTDMTLEAADRLVDRLEAPYPERILRAVRAVLAGVEPPAERVRALARLADQLGLQPSPPPEPLPEIEDDDVHLVCWLGITPAAS
jgi:hypothetical protein